VKKPVLVVALLLVLLIAGVIGSGILETSPSATRGTARVRDLGDGKLLRTFSGHEEGVVGVGFGLSSRIVLTADGKGNVRSFDRETGRRSGGHDRRQGAGSRESRRDRRREMAEVGTDRPFRPRVLGRRRRAGVGCATPGDYYRRRSRECVHATLFQPTAVDAGHGRVVYTSKGGAVMALDLTTGAGVRRFSGHGARAPCVALGPHGRVAASGGEDARILLWKLAD
jgi:WD40 repeat protein